MLFFVFAKYKRSNTPFFPKNKRYLRFHFKKICSEKKVSLSKEYDNFLLRKSIRNYFQNKQKNILKAQKENTKIHDILPSYYRNKNFFKPFFGKKSLDFELQGMIDLKFGGHYASFQNPNLSEENQSIFSFDFQQNLNTNLNTKIGNLLNIKANYDYKCDF